MNSFALSTPREFSFDQCLHFLLRSPREILHRVTERTVTKLIRFEGNDLLFQVEDTDGALQVQVLLGQSVEGARESISQFIKEWFDLETDLKPFYKLAAKDPFLKNLVRQFYGYRIVGQPDLYEALVWAVIGQQINLSFAYTLKQKFVQEYGRKLVYEGQDYFLFPEPQIVAQLGVEDLLKLQFSRQKSKYTIAISEAFANGSLSKEVLGKLSFHEAKETLRRIKGVGNWTANYALMKTFRYPDAFPLEDAGLHNALRVFLKLDRKPSLDEVREVFKKYKGWEAYATLYLWRSL